MAFIYDLADTWNNVGTTFTGIKLNVTDTASAAGSLLMDLQVGGVSRFRVNKDGSLSAVNVNSSSNSVNLFTRGTGGPVLNLYAAGSSIWPELQFQNNSGSAFVVLEAANTLAQRNGVNAQTSRIYGTFTDASNYRRLTQTMSAVGVAEIKPEGLGTGVTGNVLHISGLPTSNPGAGILWNDAGTVKVGT